MNRIEREVKILHKSTKGEITVQSIMRFLEHQGYSVVFFNTDEGDHLLRSYGLYPCKTNAITYCGNTKVVFVDENIHATDKLYALLHECGHILLNHLDDMLNKRAYENEAEAFAYKALNYSPPKTLRNVLLSLLAVALIIAGTVFFPQPDISPAIQNYVPTEASSDVNISRITSNEPVNESVYVTKSGTKYHRANCRYVKNKNASELQKIEAEKTHDPCSICKP